MKNALINMSTPWQGFIPQINSDIGLFLISLCWYLKLLNKITKFWPINLCLYNFIELIFMFYHYPQEKAIHTDIRPVDIGHNILLSTVDSSLNVCTPANMLTVLYELHNKWLILQFAHRLFWNVKYEKKIMYFNTFCHLVLVHYPKFVFTYGKKKKRLIFKRIVNAW